MRIAIDARLMGAQRTRGIGRYIQELAIALMKEAPENDYVLITAEKPTASFLEKAEWQRCFTSWYGWEEQAKMSAAYEKSRADVVFVPHWNVSLEWSMKQRIAKKYGWKRPFFALTIHDLLLFHQPESAKISTRNWLIRNLKRQAHRLVVSQAVLAADVLFVPTETVALDVKSFFPEITSRLVVTGEGMPEISPWQEIERDRLETKFEYLLYVGSAYPHKGLMDVLEAWPQIVREFPEMEFWFVGEKDQFMSELEAQVQRRGLKRIRFLGRVADEELTFLYRQARAFVYPSTFEGFGLPPLEALSQGCPVIVRDLPVLREVLQPARVFFFETMDKDGILQAVRRVCEKEVEVVAEEAWQDAHILAKRHEWQQAARRVLHSFSTP